MSLKAFQATFEGSSGKHYKQETKVDGKKVAQLNLQKKER